LGQYLVKVYKWIDGMLVAVALHFKDLIDAITHAKKSDDVAKVYGKDGSLIYAQGTVATETYA
jgi:hypothetical protein